MPILLETIQANLAAGSATVAMPGSGTSQPGGLECRFQYNNLVMHDRQYIDKIRITKIDGLQDAEVRDSRDVNPADHGETPFEAWYGGRTITFEGRIEAFNVNKLRDMQQAFRFAFSGLKENPLYFLKASAISYGGEDIRINCRKYSAIQMSEQQSNGSNLYRDFQLTLRASKPWFESANEIEQTIDFGILDEFSSDSISASPYYTYDTGSGLVVSNGALYATAGSTNQVYRNSMGYDPSDLRTTIKYSTTGSVTNWEIGQMHRRLSATFGLLYKVHAYGASSYLSINTVNTDITTLATSSMFTLSASTSYWFRTAASGNMLSAEHWATDPYQSGLSASVTLEDTLSGSDVNSFGVGRQGKAGLFFSSVPYNMPFDDYRLEPLALNHQVLTIYNDGNFNARPVIRLYGPFADTTITNETYIDGETSYRSMTIDGGISASTYYEYDVANSTLRDVSDNNKFSQLNIESKDIVLAPGENRISILSSSLFDAPKLTVFFRNTWM